jgi:hypothetical protein
MTEILRLKNLAFLSKFLPASLIGAFPDICQTALVDGSGIIITQTGTYNRSQNGSSA